jgi:hypothetical protein
MGPKKLVVLLLTAAALGVPGCKPNQGEVEKTVKKGMEEQLHVQIKSLTLTPQSGGGYTGKAEASNGNTYDVTVTTEGSQYKWRAVPDQASLERMVTKGIQDQRKIQIKSLKLTKQAQGNYQGTAEAANGTRYEITVTFKGTQIEWKAKRVAPAKGK